MWIAIFSFSLFILFIGIFFYGLSKWDKLLVETTENEIRSIEPTTTMQRLPIWLLIAGMAIFSLISDLAKFL